MFIQSLNGGRLTERMCVGIKVWESELKQNRRMVDYTNTSHKAVSETMNDLNIDGKKT